MLQKLRDKTSGWIATVIVGLLIIPFAFFGLEQYMVGGASNNAAIIKAPPSWWRSAPSFWPVSMLWDEDQVTLDEFRVRMDAVRQQRRQIEGEAFDAREFEALPSRLEILDGLIDERVQAVAAAQSGMVVGDAMVRQVIQEIPAFQVDGRFDAQRYRMALASRVPAQTPAQFEQEVRATLEQSLLGTAVAGTGFVTPGELERVVQLLGERRDVSVVLVPPDGEAAAGEVTDEEVQAWYDGHREDYLAPENVTIEYIVLDADELPEPPAADETTLRQRYAEQLDRQADQTRWLASHILLEVPEDAEPAREQEIQARASQLAEQARGAGADFAALAAEHSEDTGSADLGGDLGWISPGMMPAAIDETLAALEPGAVSDPVRSDFGWHVLQLREASEGERESFEDARERLAAEQAELDRDALFNETSSRIVDAVLQDPASLGPAAAAVGLEVQVLGPFTRDSMGGLAGEPLIRRAAFSEAQVQDGMISDPIMLEPGRSVWLQVVEHNPEQARPLAEVREDVVAAVRAQRLRDRAAERARELEAGIAGAGSLALLAEAEGLDAPQAIPGVPRGAPLVAPGVTDAIFSAPVPGEDTLSTGHVVLDDGSIALFTVDVVVPGDETEVPPDQAAMLRDQLAQVGGIADLEALVKVLRERMEIEVFEQNL